MAQVYGFLREGQATHGEKVVLNLLKQNLPKEFAVYVECPLPGKRVHRYPDFIVVTNYGVIVLEVKDWIEIIKADRFGADIRTRGNKIRHEHNPVDQARSIAILLAEELRSIKDVFQHRDQIEIPWGYAVVMPNLPTAVVTRLRQVWGEEFVLNTFDLDPSLILSRLKVTLPENKVRDLRKHELDFIRATINPTVLIEATGRPAIILDEEQEQIVAEPVKVKVLPSQVSKPEVEQRTLFEEEQPESVEKDEQMPDYEYEISRNTAIRLVRGVAGSGKTLVMTQRARYLAAHYPDWRILVLTYNNQLRGHFDAILKGIPNLKVATFHSFCCSLLRNYMQWEDIVDPNSWISDHKRDYPVVQKLGATFIEDEIKWLKEIGIPDVETYLTVERKGRGRQVRLTKSLREEIFAVAGDYQSHLRNNGLIDWADVPHLVLKGFKDEQIKPPDFDAVLIDEAQDFAPVWIRVVTRLLNSGASFIFLADDPAQSIYRFYSWREKGVRVVGRTRWLKVPYRNTYEIYQAAYQLIATDPKLQKSLEEEGLLVVPELSNTLMRHGPRPLIQRYKNFDDEVLSLKGRIDYLLQHGYDRRQIAVLHRNRGGVKRLEEALRGYDVNINTFHAFKGLEFDAVFLCQLQDTLVRRGNEDERSAERRLVYMAMTRARQQLFMGYQGSLPKKYQVMQKYAEFVD
ncbi:MAG: UvrD-helicase domain-containing protein [Anaerolineales bacterium]|jgi:hypothetical protein